MFKKKKTTIIRRITVFCVGNYEILSYTDQIQSNKSLTLKPLTVILKKKKKKYLNPKKGTKHVFLDNISNLYYSRPDLFEIEIWT